MEHRYCFGMFQKITGHVDSSAHSRLSSDGDAGKSGSSLNFGKVLPGLGAVVLFVI